MSIFLKSEKAVKNGGFWIFAKMSLRIFQIFDRNVELNYRFSYAGNWELVKSVVGTKFRRSYVCLHSQVKNRP